MINVLVQAKNYKSKIRIYQKTPEVKYVQETTMVPKLFYEERLTLVTKNRVVMVDVEEIVKVPVIKEVKKMKKIKVYR